MFRITLLFLLVLPMCLSAEEPSKESLLNKLFAPGPLIEGHKKLEKIDCLECHGAGKGVPDSKCLNCHKEIKRFVDKKSGYHGLNIAKKQCFECHGDHKGRDHDTTEVNHDKFDHSKTGYKLEGKHAKIRCHLCHKQKRVKKHIRKNDLLYVGLVTSCKECHKKEDVHKFKKGPWKDKDCSACHGLASWKKDTKFDHYKDTKYRLGGAHKKMKCAECHGPSKKMKVSKYKWSGLKKDKCLSCHKDHHGTKLSKKFRNGDCSTCHTEDKWKINKFDHKKATKYALKDKHKGLKCTKCHKQSKLLAKKGSKHYIWLGLKNKCSSCHQDTHKYNPLKSRYMGNLNQCNNCHSEKGWKKIHSFNHNSKTDYPITGKHMKLKCTKCHTPSHYYGKSKKVKFRKYQWQKLDVKTCEACHKNPHTKSKSSMFNKKRCDQCHVTSGWNKRPKNNKNFKHNETRFKLTGKHKKLKCKECHKSGYKSIYKFLNFKKDFCIDCHDNPHRNQFHEEFSEKSCKECHGTRTFKKIKKFNHSKTSFKLKGEHKKLKCNNCHVKTKQIKTKAKQKPKTWHKYLFPNLKSESCTTCHTDFHKKQLGKKCQTCHSEKTWKIKKFNHTLKTTFELKGKHKKVRCNKCHTKERGKFTKYKNSKGKWIKVKVRRYKPIEQDCNSCHKKDDKHKGDFGTGCKDCHVEDSWKKTKDFHKNFTLHGAHYILDCKECHINDRKLSDTGDDCIYCHQKDDVHRGSLPNCTECHRQNFWEHNRFRHAMTSFPLRGTHRTLDCFQCHKQNNYEGTTGACIDCHGDRLSAVPSHVAAPAAFSDCAKCHNQFTFK